MFEALQNSLIEKKSGATSAVQKTEEVKKDGNPFVNAGLKKSAEIPSGNNALKYKTTGNSFVDQFGLLGAYKVPRKYVEIAHDAATLHSENPLLGLSMILFMRMVTRVVQLFNGNKTKEVQRGAGLKHEGIVRMIWLQLNHPKTFWKNIHLFIAVGSWKDITQMLMYDLTHNGWNGRVLDWTNLGKVILAGLENPKTSNLVKKYLPKIRATSQCKTLEAQADNMIAKWICSLLFGSKKGDETKSYKQYRQFKTSGTAHEWQKLISQKKMMAIDFNTIHGRALAQLVSSRFLKNQGLEQKYAAWIATKPTAKFTGYVAELVKNLGTSQNQIDTFNAQFKGLVETAKKGSEQVAKWITVIDTSGSMDIPAVGIDVPNILVAKSLALFFNEMYDKGPFADTWYEFSDTAKLHQIKGSTPYEKWVDMNQHRLCCSTEFMAVIEHFCGVKDRGEAEEKDFPTGFLCLSDGEFNPHYIRTNSEAAFARLGQSFSKEFVDNFSLVFWNLASKAYGNTAGRKFETFGDTPNVFYYSGYDGSTVAFLEKKPKTANELFEVAMKQEIMSYIEL